MDGCSNQYGKGAWGYAVSSALALRSSNHYNVPVNALLGIVGVESNYGANTTPPIGSDGRLIDSSVGLIQAQNGWWQQYAKGHSLDERTDNALAMDMLAKYISDAMNGLNTTHHEHMSLEQAIASFHIGMGAEEAAMAGNQKQIDAGNHYLNLVEKE